MEGKVRKIITFLSVFLLGSASAYAQQNSEPADSLVRLMQGSSVQLIETNGLTYRKAVDATFLHNGTYLICDTALWNVDLKVINAEGHVQVMQEGTVLTSDRLDYSIDENMARFRGGIVQLQDRQQNTLRTRHLDYNTKDSTATFANGASMRDKDGQIIESLDGTYNTKEKMFTFRNEVNMFTDSVFVKTELLTYESNKSLATFHSYVDFWKDGNMLSADGGWYNRGSETFFFEGKVHATSEKQEAWCDRFYFYRRTNDINLLDNAQIQDTTRNIAALADYIYYCDTLARVEMRKQAAVALRTEQEGRIDTLYFGADTIIYHTVKRNAIEEPLIADAKTRKEEIMTDPVSLYRQKAAKDAAAAAAEAAAKDPNLAAKASHDKKGGRAKGAEVPPPPAAPDPQADSLKRVAAALKAAADSTARADSIAAIKADTTKFGFLIALRHVKAYRKDIQLTCDSLRYNDLDSIARFYIEPVIWNDSVRQYSSDSIYVLVKNSGMDRASLMSNAMVVTQEDSTYYDQIKGAEIMAYFDSTAALSRFDALGGANAIFLLKENEAFATANMVECKMLSGVFANGNLDKVYYFESPKNDAYPVAQLRPNDLRMKGFEWRTKQKPMSRKDITTLEVKPSERSAYNRHPRTRFRQTDEYFPGYIAKVYREIAIRDSLRALPPPPPLPDTAKFVAPVDSLPLVDSVKTAVTDSLAKTDSLAAPTDSLKAPADSLSASGDSVVVDPKVLAREKRKAEREAKEKARIEARDKRWAELDARDAAKAEAKKQKELERKRERTRKEILRQREEEARDAKKLEQYKKKFEKQKSRKLKKDGTVN